MTNFFFRRQTPPPSGAAWGVLSAALCSLRPSKRPREPIAPIFYFGSVFFISSWKIFFFFGGIGTSLQDRPPLLPKFIIMQDDIKEEPPQQRGMQRWPPLPHALARDSPLLTGSNLGCYSHSRSRSWSPQGAGHGSWGDGVTHPPNRMTMRMTSPPSGTSPAPSGMDLASNPTTTNTTIRLPAEASSATQPPQAQDAVLVYTITSLMDSPKPYSAATTPTTTGTRSYLKAVSPTSGLRVAAPAFTPVGVNPVDRYTSTQDWGWKGELRMPRRSANGRCHHLSGHWSWLWRPTGLGQQKQMPWASHQAWLLGGAWLRRSHRLGGPWLHQPQRPGGPGLCRMESRQWLHW
jgi:hypothetical protein